MNKSALLILFFSALLTLSCSKDDEVQTATPEAATYKIINNGNGGVTTISDNSDTSPLEIAQAIPSVSDKIYASNFPIVFFFNDKILLPSITTQSFRVLQNGIAVGGVVSINQASNGFAILTFIPKKQFAANADILITLTTDLQDDAGNGLFEERVISYKTNASVPSDFSSNSGFENGNDGVNFVGDGAIIGSGYGCLSPFEGSKFAAITTGTSLVSSETAIGEASSILILGPVPNAVSSVTFKYNFLSAEFQEFVNSLYDDSFVAIVYGDDGAYSELISSVNIIGTEGNTFCTGFPGMPDNGDTYSGSTGWRTATLNFPSVGANAHVIFIATDVEDTIYSTVVGIDNVIFGN